ncbi:hypothetical protein HPB50_004156 [Hyalomma asiaticum]|uniref:Uncharacterized protein n=1 Tax=Hyalomma asiaticum TaxID=266040 RepID=A0ACB7TIB1_HYAAI|nr:hypothetical protein HPB50_004156 [Hyalomma asiaticum]
MVLPYNPASNGAAEWVAQTIKEKLKKSQAGDSRMQVARVLLQCCATPVNGLKTPLDVLRPDFRSTALLKQLKQKLAADQWCRPGPLPESGAPVLARNFHNGPPWSAAGQVVIPTSASSLLACMPNGTT